MQLYFTQEQFKKAALLTHAVSSNGNWMKEDE